MTPAAPMDAEALGAFLAREFPQVAGELRVERAEPGGVTLRLLVAERHLRPGGTVSGPSMFLLGDVAAYCAVLARIGPRALAVTTGASIDFLRKPGPGRDLLCDAAVLKLGRTLAVVDTRLRSDGKAEPVGRASFTYALPTSRRDVVS